MNLINVISQMANWKASLSLRYACAPRGAAAGRVTQRMRSTTLGLEHLSLRTEQAQAQTDGSISWLDRCDVTDCCDHSEKNRARHWWHILTQVYLLIPNWVRKTGLETIHVSFRTLLSLNSWINIRSYYVKKSILMWQCAHEPQFSDFGKVL